MDPIGDLARRIEDSMDGLVQGVTDQVVERVVKALEINELLDRVDVNALLDRIALEPVLERIDIDKLLDRIDVNRLMSRVDVDALVERTELGSIVANATTGIATVALDAVRSQGVGLDVFFHKWVNRLLRRGNRPVPTRPGDSEAGTEQLGAGDQDPTLLDISRQGHYAGGLTRLVAFGVDAAVSMLVFVTALAAASYGLQLVTGHSVNWNNIPILTSISLAVWEFVYFAYPWATSGRTLGMALLGIRVVRGNGTRLDPKHAVIRTLAFPFSFLLFGLGFVGIVVGRRRRALHDEAADTAVVYSWDARAAHLRFIARGD